MRNRERLMAAMSMVALSMLGSCSFGRRTSTVSEEQAPYIKLRFVDGFSFDRAIVYARHGASSDVRLGINTDSGGDSLQIDGSGSIYEPYRYSFGYRQNWLQISTTDATSNVYISRIEMWTA